MSSPDFTKSQNCVSDCQYHLSTWMLNRHLKLSMSRIKAPDASYYSWFSRTKDLEYFKRSHYCTSPRYSIRESYCFYLQNVSCTKTRLIFLLLPMVQVTMVLFGLLLWPPNWSPCFCASPPHFQRRQWHPTPVLLPGKSHGWRSLVGCSPRGREESDTTERLPFHFSLVCIGEGDGNPLQSYCLENPRDGGAWWADICGVAESDTTEVTWQQQQHPTSD